MHENRKENIQILIKFLRRTEEILESIVKTPQDYILNEFAKDQEMMSSLSDAWKEVSPKISEVIEKLTLAKQNIFRKLSEVGLSGHQLRFKWESFLRHREQFAKKRTNRMLRRLLGCINTILRSLSNVFPSIDAVNEFKEIIEHMLKVDRRKPRGLGSKKENIQEKEGIYWEENGERDTVK